MGLVPVALSSASLFPLRAPDAFEMAARLGYDGVEIMITADPVSQDAEMLRRLSDFYEVPVLAVHAPNLLVTQRVWGRDPWRKLDRARELAEATGAGVVVVHPPFVWQREYVREFEPGLAELGGRTPVKFAVENLYPLFPGGSDVAAYAPHWNPAEIDCQYATLDVSHAAVSGSDAVELAAKLDSRLAHVHLGDGTLPGLPDEHLVPGRGSQPCAALLRRLSEIGYRGAVVLEVSTHRASVQQRHDDLAESLAFARRYLNRTALAAAAGASPEPGPPGTASEGRAPTPRRSALPGRR